MSEETLPLLDMIRKLEESIATMRKGVLAMTTELSDWKERATKAEAALGVVEARAVKSENEIKEALQVLTDFFRESDLEAVP